MTTRCPALALAWLLVVANPASAQPANQSGTQGTTCPCPMCNMMQGPMGVVMMVLAAALVLAVIGVLVALTVFLIRRSRSPRP